MNKLISRFCLALTILFSIPGFSQDTIWKNVPITSDVAVFMPGLVYNFDTTLLKTINSQYDGYFFQIRYVTKKIEVHSGDELVQGYDGFLKGALNSKEMKVFTNTVVDTSLSGTTGVWVHSTYSKTNLDMYTYVVLVNSYFYMVSIGAYHPINMTNDTILSRYYSSLHFKTPIKEYSGNFPLQTKSYRFGQKLGRGITTFLPYFLLIGIAILVVVLVIRKKKGDRS